MSTVVVAVGDADVRAVVRMVVNLRGHTVREVATYADATTVLLASAEPCVVLLDSHLGGDGYAAALRLLELAHAGALYRHAFILLSTDGTTRLPAALQLLRGVLSVPVVPMPFDIDELLNEVDRARWQLLPEVLVKVERVARLEAAAYN
jgi:CheY-like chemotaxis protein